jgi:ABC-type transport system involved in cytochrome bd biosynthesis fused ATPase/permease subunit
MAKKKAQDDLLKSRKPETGTSEARANTAALKVSRKPSDIIIRGARVHNLKNVSLTLPRNKLIVVTGVSGSGKSSLAFDTIYAEANGDM